MNTVLSRVRFCPLRLPCKHKTTTTLMSEVGVPRRCLLVVGSYLKQYPIGVACSDLLLFPRRPAWTQPQTSIRESALDFAEDVEMSLCDSSGSDDPFSDETSEVHTVR